MDLTLRHYGLSVGDYQLISGWYQRRHGKPLPETLLPPLGVVCEDWEGPIGAAWAIQALGIGIAYLDPVITRPGLTPQQSRDAIRWCLEGLTAALKSQDYGLLRCHPESSVLAGELLKMGFDGANNNLFKLI